MEVVSYHNWSEFMYIDSWGLSDEMSFMHRENNKGPRTVPWGDTRQNRSPVRFYSIYNNSLLSEAKKRIYPFQCLATNFIAKQFTFKEFMRWCIKCLFKIQHECVTLSSIVQDFNPIVYYHSQLSFTTMSFPECMLPIWQEFVFIKMSHNIWTYYVFEQLARYTSQGNRAIIARKWPVTLLEKGADICKRTFLWDFTSVNWLLKMMSKYRT